MRLLPLDQHQSPHGKAKLAPKNKKESLEQYRDRLMSTFKVLLRKTIAHMKPRIEAVYEAEGDHIKID